MSNCNKISGLSVILIVYSLSQSEVVFGFNFGTKCPNQVQNFLEYGCNKPADNYQVAF
tara:strand:- start:1142 stop:1315 length:174 start_codon:yes stop_codon:yes gene_type:complete